MKQQLFNLCTCFKIFPMFIFVFQLLFWDLFFQNRSTVRWVRYPTMRCSGQLLLVSITNLFLPFFRYPLCMSKNITQFESLKIITVLFLRFLIPSLSCHKGWLDFKYKNQPMTKKDLLDGLVSKVLPNKRYQMHIMLKKSTYHLYYLSGHLTLC